MCSHAQSLQSCLTLCDPMDCSRQAPLSGVLQARRLEGVATPSSRDLPDPGIEPMFPGFPALQVVSLPLSHWGSPGLRHG